MKLANKDRSKADKHPGFFGKLLFNTDVYRRVGGYLLCGLLLFIVAWAVGYFLLSEGFLKNTFLVDKIFGVKGSETLGTWWAERLGETIKIFKWEINTADTFVTWGNILLVTVKIFAHHFLIVLLFVFFLNRFKVGRSTLALFYFLIYTVLTGLVAGTNSYPYPAQGLVRIGALVTFLRFAVWVWFSYSLLLASTVNWTWLQTSSFTDGSWQKEGKFWSGPQLFGDTKEVFIFGLLFLLVSSFAEARLIVFYGHHLF